MRDQSDVYLYAKSSSKLKLEKLIEELHSCYDTRNRYFEILSSYKDDIIKSGLSYTHIESIYNGTALSKFYIPSGTVIVEDNETNEKLLAILRYYNYNWIVKIPQIEELIETYSLVLNTPYYEFVKVTRLYNRACAKRVMQGDYIIFPKVAKIHIDIVKRPKDKLAINWRESNIYKRYLINNDIQPKDYNNPDGEQWLIFFTDDTYLRWTWRKTYCKTANGAYYFFQTTSYFNDETVDKLEERLHTVDEIIDSPDMGNLQKSLMLSRKFEEINKVYKNGI